MGSPDLGFMTYEEWEEKLKKQRLKNLDKNDPDVCKACGHRRSSHAQRKVGGKRLGRCDNCSCKTFIVYAK